MKDVLFLGDSLVEYGDWQSRFPGHRISNLGIAGETVEGLLSRTDRIIKREPAPDLVFIMTGINNVAMDDLAFIAPYRTVVRKLSSAFLHSAIFVHSLLPAMLDWVSNQTIRGLNEEIREMARETGADFLDLYGLFTTAEGTPVKEYLLPDGVHLSPVGYRIWSGALERIIEQ